MLPLRFHLALLGLSCCLGGACSTTASPDAGAAVDLGAADLGATALLDSGATDAGARRAPWPHTLRPSLALGSRRGLRAVRAVIHAHSPISHDACDGAGFDGSTLIAPACLADLRRAVCQVQLDALMLTDHSEHTTEVTHEARFFLQPGDQRVSDTDGRLMAARWSCPNGHFVLVTVGNEDALMSVGLHRHVLENADPARLADAYDADGPSAVAALRAAGALVLVPHTESRGSDYLRTLGMDGVEVYNIHANIDPRIRPMWLGLEDGQYLADMLQFTSATSSLEADLAFLAFFQDLDAELLKWAELLAAGQHVLGTAGTDAHQNSFPQPMNDGERGDSYRRMMRFFSNHLLVPTGATPSDDDVTVASTHAAIRGGRSYIAFEAFGTPVGFDWYATDGGATSEVGSRVGPGATLRVIAPVLGSDYPQSPAPRVTLRILRATPTGWVEVARGDGPELVYLADTRGAYRSEARIVPEHARPYVARLAPRLIHEFPWVYGNAIFVE